MEDSLKALGQLLLQALPTFFLVLILHFFLKAVFFKPLARILEQRRQATEGARQQAEESLKRAGEKAAEYEVQLRAARNDLYREQEQQRAAWREEQSGRVAGVRRESEAVIQKAKSELAGDVAEARTLLQAESELLASEITRAVLERRAS